MQPTNNPDYPYAGNIIVNGIVYWHKMHWHEAMMLGLN